MKLTKTQTTYVPTEKEIDSKKWFLVDVKGKTLGLISTKIADILRGKLKVHFTPQHDCGDYVVVINAKEIRLAGNKMDSKTYHSHSGYGSGFKTRTARQLIATKPEKIIYDSVWGMLPRNKLRSKIIKKLRIFPGTEHEHTSQSPETITL